MSGLRAGSREWEAAAEHLQEKLI